MPQDVEVHSRREKQSAHSRTGKQLIMSARAILALAGIYLIGSTDYGTRSTWLPAFPQMVRSAFIVTSSRCNVKDILVPNPVQPDTLAELERQEDHSLMKSRCLGSADRRMVVSSGIASRLNRP